MDATRWKSVAVRIDDYKLLRGLCDIKFSAPAAMIGKLVSDYIEYQAKKTKTTPKALRKQLLNDHVNNQEV